MDKDFSTLEAALGVDFKNQDRLREALTHRSYLNENRSVRLPHNERLEFLGDAVLELVITDHLYRTYPTVTEGELTAYRAALVNAVIIGEIAESLGINDYLLLSKGEAKGSDRARAVILANTFEAIIGAIYLDQGYDVAEQFIARTIFPLVEEIVRHNLWQDAKSLFQEKAQEIVGITPRYDVLEATGPDHDKRFVVGVYLGDNLVAQGEGQAKQEAEQEAARAGLRVRGWSV